MKKIKFIFLSLMLILSFYDISYADESESTNIKTYEDYKKAIESILENVDASNPVINIGNEIISLLPGKDNSDLIACYIYDTYKLSKKGYNTRNLNIKESYQKALKMEYALYQFYSAGEYSLSDENAEFIILSSEGVREFMLLVQNEEIYVPANKSKFPIEEFTKIFEDKGASNKLIYNEKSVGYKLFNYLNTNNIFMDEDNVTYIKDEYYDNVKSWNDISEEYSEINDKQSEALENKKDIIRISVNIFCIVAFIVHVIFLIKFLRGLSEAKAHPIIRRNIAVNVVGLSFSIILIISVKIISIIFISSL